MKELSMLVQTMKLIKVFTQFVSHYATMSYDETYASNLFTVTYTHSYGNLILTITLYTTQQAS